MCDIDAMGDAVFSTAATRQWLKLRRETRDAKAQGVPLDLLTTIAVPEAEADPARIARRKQAFAETRRQRGQH